MNRRWRVGVVLLFAVAGCEGQNSEPQTQGHVEPIVAVKQYRFDSASSDVQQHGERLSAVLGCVGCHTQDLTGEDWSDPDLGVLWTANLTHSVVEYSEAELIEMIVAGRRPDRALLDMPSYLFSEIHADDLAALVSYLQALSVKGDKRPEPTIGPQLAKTIESGEFKDSTQWVAAMQNQAPPDLGPEHAFGRFILRATCAECHGMDLNGSTDDTTDAPPRPSLRIVAAYSAEDFSNLMKDGIGLGGRELNLMSGVSRSRYSRLTDNERDAIYNYLLALSRQPP